MKNTSGFPTGFLIFFGGLGAFLILAGKLLDSGLYTVVGALIVVVDLFLIFYAYADSKEAHDHPREYAERKQKESEERQEELELEKARAEASQRQPWGTKYLTTPCPYCGHYKVRYSDWDDKKVSVAFWGAASTKIAERFKCDYCHRMWK